MGSVVLTLFAVGGIALIVLIAVLLMRMIEEDQGRDDW